MFQTSQRGFGGMPGGPREKVSSNSINTDFKLPNEADIKYHTPAKYQPNDMFLAWVSTKLPFDRMSDRLLNDKPNKWAAYYWFGNSALGNTLVLKAVRTIFGRQEGVNNVIDSQGSYNGITTHENGLFLYQSKEARHAVMTGYSDWVALGATAAWLGGVQLCLLPMLISYLYIPRRWTQSWYFTWHAELLPHTEQVVFHKSTLGGGIIRHIVDIKNLEKVEAEDAVINNLMWTGNMFDKSLIFRNAENGEVFVFDKNGIWNEEVLKHPLLY